jgi:hypothetical protein
MNLFARYLSKELLRGYALSAVIRLVQPDHAC